MRSLIRTLLEAGDIPGAVSLMITGRGLVEQAHSQAITDGILLGKYAYRRLAKDLVDALSDSLAEVRLASYDDYCDIVDAFVEFLQSENK